MMQENKKSIPVSQLWSKLEEEGYQLLDVRTPAEYHKGHIPLAGTLPLFNDHERIIVGTSYKKESPKEAFIKGLDLVAPKMTTFIREAEEYAIKKKLILHCWRGGRRSGSMAWLLNMADFDVLTVEGGYKAYRRFILDQFELQHFPFIILGGRTGCGKTAILQELKKAGEQVLDLENLANHKGSAFGSLGEEQQPSVEQFENDLYELFRNLDSNKRVWVENESRSIGRIYIPQGFWNQMRKAPLINLEIPFATRVEILVEGYAKFPQGGLEDAFERIKKRLGGQRYKQAMKALEEKDFGTAAAIALSYYDKSYQFMLENNSSPDIRNIKIDQNNPYETAVELIDYCNENKW